jgi:hypothetical protein
MNIEVIDYKTNSKSRKHLIETSDLIVYVCCTNNEVKKLREPMKIGLNDFHHDYNLMHFYETYQKKCLNITFNVNIAETQNNLSTNFYSQSKSEQVSAISQCKNQFNQNTSEKDLSFVILPTVSNESSTNQSVSLSVFSNIQQAGNSTFLKLPQENDKFINYLFGNNKSDAHVAIDNVNSKNNLKSIRKKINEIPFKLLMYNVNKTITKLVKKQLKKTKSLLYLEDNIQLDDQPHEELCIFEDSDEENSSYNDETSRTPSSSRSNHGQFESVDEMTSLMPNT